jgi:hypothetical protein
MHPRASVNALRSGFGNSVGFLKDHLLKCAPLPDDRIDLCERIIADALTYVYPY